jgi:DNA-binding NtrC family response regulator
MSEGSRRLSALEGFAREPAVEAAAAVEPRRSARPRILFENLDAIGLEELPDVAHELRTLRRILDINKRLARAKDEDELLDSLLDGALTLAAAERACLVGPAEGDGVTVVRSRDPGGDVGAGTASEVTTSVARRVLAGGGAETVDMPHDAGRGAGVRSALCIPFQSERRLALWLESRREEGAFSSADADLLAAYAEQAALALERIRLLAQNQRQRDELLVAANESRGLNERLASLLERRTAELRDARADLALVDDGFSHRYPDIVGRGPATLAVLRQVDRIADTGVPVLFEGESGTGKELLARALHASSARSAGRFVAENCAALPDSLLENELFGHERGAFTGADAAAPGLFERADGGTLFLDEVGDMSVSLQKRLLRVLQEGEVRRVGGASVRKVDVRIVTATNRDLAGMVKEGTFREDLFYRLAVVKIRVPPLRERREDIPALCDHFLARLGKDGRPRRVTEAALETLVRHSWPGNIRQLDNELRRAAALSRGTIDVDALSQEILDPIGALADVPLEHDPKGTPRNLKSLVEELEMRVVRRVLDRESGNISRSARALGLSRLGLRKKLRRYKMEARPPR